MIKSTYLHRLYLEEFYQLMSDVVDFLKPLNVESLKLTNAAGKFETRFQAFDNAFKQARKTGLVDTKKEIDLLRDDLIRGLYNTLAELLRFPDAQLNAAAQRMIDAIDKFGGNTIPTMGEDAETAAITNALQELKTEDAELTKTTMWVDKLSEENTRFTQTQQAHTQKQAEYITGLMADERKLLDEEFRNLCKNIDALAVIEGEEPYRPIADYINQLVTNAQITVKQRASAKRTRDEKKAE